MTTAPPSLLNMPEVVMDRILEAANYRTIMSLRKVCHSLRSYIDNEKKPEANFQKINIHLEDDHIVLHYELRGEPENIVRYWMRENGCLVDFGRHDQKKEHFEGTSANEIFNEDFKSILKFQKAKFDRFLIFGRDIYDDQVYHEFLASTAGIIRESGNILKPYEFCTDMPRQDLILQFLPLFDPQFLKNIQLEHRRGSWEMLQMDQIVQLEQWKKLDYVSLRNVFSNPGIENFLHLKGGYLNFETISGEDLKKVKEALVSTPSMESLYIVYQNYGAQFDFGRLVGKPVIFERDEEKRWFFHLPGINDKVLYVFNDVEHDMFFHFEKTSKAHISESVTFYD